MSVAFSRWFERHGTGLDETTARKVWNAAVYESYELALEEALTQRAKSLVTAAVDAEHASAKFHAARVVGSRVFGLRA